jgi:hypothetical protein
METLIVVGIVMWLIHKSEKPEGNIDIRIRAKTSKRSFWDIFD